MRIVILIIVLQFISFLGWGQPDGPLKEYFEPVASPEVMAYKKFGDIPVDMSRGIPSVEIPIYTINEGSISLPITMRYHAGGVKVNEMPTWVGSNWNLNYGGIISRTINGGMADETPGVGFINNAQNIDYGSSDPNKLISYMDGSVDTAPDFFNFSFLGQSGEFIIDSKSDNQPIVLRTKSDLKIECIKDNSEIKGFIIKDTKGNKYRFGFGYTETTNVEEGTPYISAFYLNEIISFDDQHSVRYTYRSHNINYVGPRYTTRVFRTDNCFNNVTSVSTNLGLIDINSLHIQSIKSANTEITFVEGAERQDIQNQKELEKIVVNTSGVCFDYLFSYDYQSVDNRLGLKQIQKRTCGGSVSESHKFEYHSGSLPAYHEVAGDHWGYNNGVVKNGNELFIPKQPEELFQIYNFPPNEGFDRESNAESLHGSLKKIIYPTNGYSEFIFEPNTVKSTRKNDTPILMVHATKPVDYTRDETIIGVGDFTITDEEQLNELSISCIADPLDIDDTDPYWGYFNVIIKDLNDRQVYKKSFSVSIINNEPVVTDVVFSFTAEDASKLSINTQYKMQIELVNCVGSATLNHSKDEDYNRMVGGLRIKDILSYDKVKGVEKRSYNYNLDDGVSSGVLLVEPKYNASTDIYYLQRNNPSIQPDGNKYYRVFTENSIRRLTNSGYHVVYNRAQSLVDDVVLETKHFRGRKKYITTYPPSPAFNDPDTGKEISSTKGSSSSDTDDELIRSDYTEYYEFQPLGFEKDCYFDYQRASALRLKVVLNSYKYQIKSQTTSLDNVTTTTSYKYDDPKTVQPTEVTVTEPSDRERKTIYTYPDKDGDAVERKLVEQNRLMPLKTEYYVDGTKTDGMRKEYSFFQENRIAARSAGSGAGPYLHKEYRDEITWDGPSNDNVLQVTYNKYNTKVGKPTEIIIPGWRPYTYIWDDLSNLMSSNYEGYVKRYEYEGRLLKKATDVDGTSTSYDYDDFARLKTVTDDQRGVTTTYDYAYGDPTSGGNYIKSTTDYPSATNSDLDIIENIQYFDGLGRQVLTVAKNQGSTADQDVYTAINYDSRGRVVKEYEPYELATGTGFVNPYTGSGGPHTSKTYDDLDRVLSVAPPALGATTYTYGSDDNILYKTTMTDPDGGVMETYKNVVDQDVMIRHVGEDGAFETKYHYDPKDRVREIVPPGSTDGNINLNYTYTYRGDDLVKTKKIPDQDDPMEYWYNEKDLVAFSQDANLKSKGKYISNTYDKYGRIERTGLTNGMVNPSLGNLLSEIAYWSTGRGKGKMRRVVQRNLLPEYNLGSRSTKWLYYDNQGRLQSYYLSQAVGGDLFSVNKSFTYDGADNITETYTRTSGKLKILRTYEDNQINYAGRLEDVFHQVDLLGKKQQLAHLSYTPKGQIDQMDIGKSQDGYLLSLQHSYLDNGYLSNIHDIGSSQLFTHELMYESDGDIGSVTSSIAKGAQRRYDLTYDKYHRLKTATYTEANTPMPQNGAYDCQYRYDNRGNITYLQRRGMYEQEQATGNGIIDELTYSYSGKNRIDQITDAAPALSNKEGYSAAGNGIAYGYDANGNMTTMPDKGATVDYNHLNLPAKVTTADGYILFVYDAEGTLLRKQIYKDDTLIEEKDYVDRVEYDENEIVQIHHAYGRVARSMCTTVRTISDTVRTNNEYTGDSIYVDAVFGSGTNNTVTGSETVLMGPGFSTENQTNFLARVGPPCKDEAWTYEYTIKDYLGNTRLMVKEDADGMIDECELQSEYHYYPYGMEQRGKWQNSKRKDYDYRYNGKELHSDLGLNLYAYGFRFYDPAIGRFTGVDPLADSPNNNYMTPYHFVENNPIRFIDPDGRMAVDAVEPPGYPHQEVKRRIQNIAQGISDKVSSIGNSIKSLLSFSIGSMGEGGSQTSGMQLYSEKGKNQGKTTATKLPVGTQHANIDDILGVGSSFKPGNSGTIIKKAINEGSEVVKIIGKAAQIGKAADGTHKRVDNATKKLPTGFSKRVDTLEVKTNPSGDTIFIHTKPREERP